VHAQQHSMAQLTCVPVDEGQPPVAYWRGSVGHQTQHSDVIARGTAALDLSNPSCKCRVWAGDVHACKAVLT
jgi:hypothetical protein